MHEIILTVCMYVCMQVAKEATIQGLSPLKIKKIYVLAALMVSFLGDCTEDIVIE